MTPKAKRVLVTALVAVAAAGAAATITFLVGQGRASNLENRVTELESELQATEPTESVDAEEATATTEEEPETESEAPDDDGGSVETERQYAFVTAATESGGVISLTLDYAQFLTGAAAAEAAAAAGEESPPPNDYYVANTNPRLRTFEIATGARFEIAFDSPEDTRVLSAGEFLDAYLNDSDGVRNPGYWVTISGGKVSGAEEQWLP